ncbi:MAG: formylglycine-generating enzyme family protein [Blastocatellia bacterium]|nr:formylglycine-generating enzyme family protein [Blastocatellia bacterium]
MERFLRRFPASTDAYRALACHAALPFVLTPELLNYLRCEFLADRTEWVAEADLLLSDLCEEIGYEQFAIKLDARAWLLAEMKQDPRLGPARMEQVARRLLAWVGHAQRNDSRFRPAETQALRWGAMVYLKERREEAVREMAAALKAAPGIEGRVVAGEDFARGERLRISEVIRNLAHQLEAYPELVEYAEATTRLLTRGRREASSGAAFSKPISVAGVELPALAPTSNPAFPLVPFEFHTVTLDERGKEIERRTLTARQFVEELAPGVSLDMVEIPGGAFLMGSPESEEGRMDREGPQHEVTVPPFFIGKFTITQAQWRVVAGWEKVEIDLKPAPSNFKGDDRPVENVSWFDVKEFCARLSKKTERQYRLPSEAEWEYACRAGTTTPFAFGKTITPEIVNYDGNYPYAKAKKGKYREETIVVGSLGVANAFGLYDMHGNVWEWCEDAFVDNYEGVPVDGSARLSEGGSSRVLRGGSYFNSAVVCRAALRGRDDARNRYHYRGVRVVVSARTL